MTTTTSSHVHARPRRDADVAGGAAGTYIVSTRPADPSIELARETPGGVELTPVGRIVAEEWAALAERFNGVVPAAPAMGPDGFRATIELDGAQTSRATGKRHALPNIVRVFKSRSAARANEALSRTGAFWEKSWDGGLLGDCHVLA